MSTEQVVRLRKRRGLRIVPTEVCIAVRNNGTLDERIIIFNVYDPRQFQVSLCTINKMDDLHVKIIARYTKCLLYNIQHWGSPHFTRKGHKNNLYTAFLLFKTQFF